MPIDSIPGDVADFPDLITAINASINEINQEFTSLSSSSNGGLQNTTGQLAQTTNQSSFEGNAFDYSNPSTNVYDFLDPLFQALRNAQIIVSQANIAANAVGGIQLQANSVTANIIAAGSVTAEKISVSELSAIVADLGTITAGNITLDSSGYIRGGQTAYNTGSGFWLGYTGGAYQLSIGNGSSNALTWNGTTLSITGSLTATTGTIGGWTINASTITGGSATLNSNGSLSFGTHFGVSTTGVLTASSAIISGAITASSGTIGGWTIGSTTITGGSVTLDSTGNIRAGQTAYNTGTGFWLGTVSGTPKLSLGVSSSNYLTWDGSSLLMLGGTSPNNVIINGTGLTVGTSGARSVVVGTYSGNPASLNFYNSAGVDLMGAYLVGTTEAHISQAVGVNTVDIFANSVTFSGIASIDLSAGSSPATSSIQCAGTNSQISFGVASDSVAFGITSSACQLSSTLPIVLLAASGGIKLSNLTNFITSTGSPGGLAGYMLIQLNNSNVYVPYYI